MFVRWHNKVALQYLAINNSHYIYSHFINDIDNNITSNIRLIANDRFSLRPNSATTRYRHTPTLSKDMANAIQRR